ncbi:uncharacterized protein LOC142985884 [Anticarsia gemmatalis]|uniref:uncharacterized protein LOC142985884 n=1 Tax=Anticarsia gemmatalis TaxID=129554 RepID=UPI003F76B551
MSLKSPTGRLARWALTLQAYDLQIEYTPGKVNVIADVLSRPTCCEENPGGCEVCLVTVDMPHRKPEDVRVNQLKDPELKKIIEDLEATDDPFRGRSWSLVCHVMSIKQSLTPLYHPKANPIEWKNRDLNPQLAILVGKDHASWDAHLAAIRFAMNSATTASTGFSPAYLTFRRELRTPSDVIADMKTIVDNDNFVHNITPYLRKLSTVLLDARETHERVQCTQKKYADEGRRPPPDYNVGDLVLLKTQGLNNVGPGQSVKFIPRRDGPYRIKEVVSPTTYTIEGIDRGEHIGRYHVSHLTPYVGDVVTPVRPKRRRGRPRRYECEYKREDA